MKNEHFIKEMEDMIVPAISSTNHQAALRRALLTSSYWKESPTHRYGFFWKGGESMNFLKLSGVAIAVVVLVAVIAIGGSFNASPVRAQELVKAAYQKGITLPADQLAELNQKLGADMLSSLHEAQQAPDLTIINADVLKSGKWAGTQNPTIQQGDVTVVVDRRIFERSDVTYLRYTDTKGTPTILVIDNDKQVLMKLVSFEEDRMHKIIGPDGQEMIGVPATEFKVAE